MTCVSPPELTDEQLLAYLDDEADEDTIAHLNRCAPCRARAETLATAQIQLLARLYRFDCPDSLDLGEYVAGTLPSTRMAAIRQHLPHCPHCAAELEIFRDVPPELSALQQNALEEKALRKRIKILAAKLISGPAGGDMRPAFALRGQDSDPFVSTDEPTHLVFEAEQFQITIDITADEDYPDARAVLGLMIGQETPQVEAQLWQMGQLVTSAPVDELGAFHIPNIRPGIYHLNFIGADTEIFLPPIDIQS